MPAETRCKRYDSEDDERLVVVYSSDTASSSGGGLGRSPAAGLAQNQLTDPDREEVRYHADQRVVRGVNERITWRSPPKQYVVHTHLVSQTESEHGNPQSSDLYCDQPLRGSSELHDSSLYFENKTFSTAFLHTKSCR